MQSSFLMSLMISMSVMVHITAIIKTYNNKNNNNLSLCVSERCYDIQKFHGRVSWLEEHVDYCEVNDGRTGLMIKDFMSFSLVRSRPPMRFLVNKNLSSKLI